jgi:hypothetical protein
VDLQVELRVSSQPVLPHLKMFSFSSPEGEGFPPSPWGTPMKLVAIDASWTVSPRSSSSKSATRSSATVASASRETSRSQHSPAFCCVVPRNTLPDIDAPSQVPVAIAREQLRWREREVDRSRLRINLDAPSPPYNARAINRLTPLYSFCTVLRQKKGSNPHEKQ